MSVFISSLIITIISSAYAVLLKRKLAETYFLAISTVIAILYCFGLINIGSCLLYGIYLLIALAAACIGFLIFTIIEYKKKYNKNIFLEIDMPQGCLLYICLLAIFLFVNYGRIFYSWDDFSHWGTIVKYFYSVDALGSYTRRGLYLTANRSYYPGTSLFQYFFTRFSGEFTEYNTYIAQNILYASLFMPFVKNIFTKKEFAKQLLLFAAFLLIPLQNFGFHGGLYDSLYVDAIMGAFFGFAVLYYFVYKYEESLYGILMVSAAALLLTLSKDLGLAFSLGVIGIIIVDCLLSRRTEIAKYLSGKPGSIRKIKALALIMLPLLCTFFVKLSWSNLLQRSSIQSFALSVVTDSFMASMEANANEPVNQEATAGSNESVNNESINTDKNTNTKQLNPFQKQIVSNFKNAVYKKRVFGPNISVLYFCLTFLAFMLLFSFINKKSFSLRRITTTSLILIFGMALYQLLLLFFYIYLFGGYEGITLASYERYSSTYILGMVYFMAIFFIPNQNVKIETKDSLPLKSEKAKNKKHTRKASVSKTAKRRTVLYPVTSVVLCLLVLFFSWGKLNLLARWKIPVFFETRQTTNFVKKWWPYFMESNAYLIFQGDIGKAAWVINYELCPYSYLSNRGNDYSLSPERLSNWTFVVTPEAWENYVLSRRIKLVYVYKTDSVLEGNYSAFFPYGVQDDMFYRVESDEDHRMSLIPVMNEMNYTSVINLTMPKEAEILNQFLYDIIPTGVIDNTPVLKCGDQNPQINFSFARGINKTPGPEFLELTYTSSKEGNIFAFYDFGQGYSNEHASKVYVHSNNDEKSLLIPIPDWQNDKLLYGIRFHPPFGTELALKSVRILSQVQ